MKEPKHAPVKRGPMGGHGPGANMSFDKAKNFKGSMKKLLAYLGKYRLRILIVMIFAVLSTAFSILGPNILGEATTEMFNGIMNKIAGSGDGINFGRIGQILLTLLGLYVISAGFSYIHEGHPKPAGRHHTQNQPHALKLL